jgi:hypothetical protein
MLRFLKLVDQYVEWLLPALSHGDGQCCTETFTTTTTTTSSSSSSSSNAYRIPYPPSLGGEVHAPLHEAAMAICLQLYSSSLLAASLRGSPLAAAVRPHLMQRNAGEPDGWQTHNLAVGIILSMCCMHSTIQWFKGFWT